MKNYIKGKISWHILVVFVVALLCFNIVLFFIYHIGPDLGNYLNLNQIVKVENINHIKKPETVKGIYLTAYTTAISRLDDLISFVKKNGLNTMVIDIKGPGGEPAFHYKNPNVAKYNTEREIYNAEKVIKKLHDNGIYVIGRTFVFQDPYLVGKEPSFALKRKDGGVWADYKGVKWLDPTIIDIWKYNIDIAVEAYGLGFDEIQFDYIRFPSDGNLVSIEYANWDEITPKEVELEKFFVYISKILRKQGVKISADLFGLVCCYDNYDLGIGQVLERALPYFDFISPMMYPSHYSNGFIGYANPAEYPYGVLKYSMEYANVKLDRLRASSTVKLGELRPWIQDFDLGANYDAFKVKEQIRAIEEEHGEGFLIWNAKNVYTELN